MAIKAEHKLRLLEALDVFKAVGIAILLILAIQTLHKQGQEIEATNKIVSQLNANSHHSTSQINSLQQHIDCIATLFRQPNRAQLTITDLKNCQLTNTNSGETAVIAPPAQSSPAADSTSQPTTSDKAPSSAPKRPLLCTVTLKLLGCN
jgi:hypothetical protein